MIDYKYKFSIIISAKDSKKDCRPTIESLIKQDIGFKNNVQVIIVDTEERVNEKIYLEYKEQYPNNIKYLNNNQNEVLECIEGMYVDYRNDNYFYNPSILSNVWNFFECNSKKTDIVVYGIRNKEIDVNLYTGTIIDIYKHYDIENLKNVESFIKLDKIKQYRFDETFRYINKTLYLQKNVIEKRKIGFLNNIEILKSNEIDDSNHVYSYYKQLIEASIEQYGEVIPYIQYQIMSDIKNKIKKNVSNINNEEKSELIKVIKYYLKYIDDDIIIEQKNFTPKYKILALSLKYERDTRKDLKVKNNSVYFNNIYITSLKNNYLFKIHILEIKNKSLIIEGQVDCSLHPDDYKIYLRIKGRKKTEIQLIDDNLYDKDSIVGVFHKSKRYKIEIPLKDDTEFKIIMKYRELYEIKLNLNFGKFAKLNKDLETSYYFEQKCLIKQLNDTIFIKKIKEGNRKKAERLYQKDLININEKEIVRFRKMYFIAKRLKKKPIWLISDRTNIANDNGMHLFEYLSRNEKKAKVYFVIDKKSNDYKKIKRIGRVLAYNSLKYKLYFLLASKIISSQADEWVLNAFNERDKYIRDLYNFKFVFLQHGITKDDLSKWLNRFNKNISIFVTSTQKEYDSIINGKYIYTDEQVKLTGFPRYDTLKNNPKRQIIFMPTWRKNIVNTRILGSSLREYNDDFKETDYCKFYNKLINDERIIKALRENNYTAKFYIHPSAIQQYKDFKSNEYVEVKDGIANYQKEFEESCLLITDYSSVAFDFAYLKKPIIYTQYDIDTFFEGHLYKKGYFDYESDGFGPVCYDYETSVNEIVKVINNNCKVQQKYLERVNSFYTYNDKNNCKRVHEEILKLK